VDTATLARALGAQLFGLESQEIQGVAALDAAGPTDLVGLFEPRWRAAGRHTRAGAALVTEALAHHLPAHTSRLVLADADAARAAWGRALRLLHPRPSVAPPPPGIDARAAVDGTASVHPSAAIGPFVVVGAGAKILSDVAVFAGAYVGAGVELGAGCVLHPGAVVLDGCVLGAGVFVGARAVIGSPGFGLDAQGRVPHIGRVVVGAGASIGAGTCIDRGTVGDTVVGAGAHLDNLVQVGHNAYVGENAVLCGQVGLAGGARVEAYAVLGGQAGVAGGVVVGRAARVAAQSGVTRSLPAGGTYSGHPAEENTVRLRRLVRLKRLASP
jgi:UDP-3-O-[3-hydroxymyristoyl] glucosamine N-acyltransferase